MTQWSGILPPGSVVMLKGATRRLQIMGLVQANAETKKLYDYCAVPFPEGYAGPNRVIMFQHEDIDRIYMDENTVVGSDAVIETAKDHMHPRAFGTFARSICRFHKEKGLVSFEEAVRKQTSLTAERWGLANKGLIRDGYDADLVLLDYDALRDRADYVNPRQLTEGIEKVFVAGKCVFTDGHLTDEKPGRLLRKMR